MKVRFTWDSTGGEIEIEDWWFNELKEHPEYLHDQIFDSVHDNYSPNLILNKEDLVALQKALKIGGKKK